MKNIKKICMRTFFGLEMILFGGIYLFGPHGMRALMSIEQEKEVLVQEIAGLQADVNGLEQSIVLWDAHPLYKEKIAREQLQMACKNDEIYYIS